MRFAIFTNNRNYYHKPLAEGLKRMFDAIGVESELLYEGHDNLNKPWDIDTQHGLKNTLLSTYQKSKLKGFFKSLKHFDAFIIIEGLPTIYRKDRYQNLERALRSMYPSTPIVLYSNYYLGTMPNWMRWLKNGCAEEFVPSNDNYLFERFDWYLATTLANIHPLPAKENPVTSVGVNFNDGTLYTEDHEFRALIDFERPKFMKERLVQLRALEETNTPYTVLNSKKSVSEIRKIYRETSIYFLAHMESFGFPVAELQACGSYVFIPYNDWCPGFFIKDTNTMGAGELGNNFRVYNNDLETLKAMITQAKETYNASKVRQDFLQEYPELYYGNLEGLKDFVEKVRNGTINAKNHLSYKNLADESLAIQDKHDKAAKGQTSTN